LKYHRFFVSHAVAIENATAPTIDSSSIKSVPPLHSFLYTSLTTYPFTVEPDLKYFGDLLSGENLPRLKHSLEMRAHEHCEMLLHGNFLEDLSEKFTTKVLPCWTRRKELKSLIFKETDERLLEKLKAEELEVKSNLRQYRSIVLDCLKLPNLLDDSAATETREKSQHNISTELLSKVSKSLMDSGQFVFKTDPDQLFLKNDAAVTVRKFISFWREQFDAWNYMLISPPHFVRSAIVEAVEGAWDLAHLHKLAPTSDVAHDVSFDVSGTI